MSPKIVVKLILFSQLIFPELATAWLRHNTCNSARDSILSSTGLGALDSLVKDHYISDQACAKFSKIPNGIVSKKIESGETVAAELGMKNEKGDFLNCDQRSGDQLQMGFHFKGIAPSDVSKALQLFKNVINAFGVTQIKDRDYNFKIYDLFDGNCSFDKFEAKLCVSSGLKAPLQNEICDPVAIDSKQCKQLGFFYQEISDAKFEAIDSARRFENAAEIKQWHRDAALKVLGPAVISYLKKTGITHTNLWSTFSKNGVIQFTQWENEKASLPILEPTFFVNERGNFSFQTPNPNVKDLPRQIVAKYPASSALGQFINKKANKDLIGTKGILDVLVRFELAKMVLLGSACERFYNYLPKEN